MRTSVAAAWPTFCSAFEGRCSWLYLDSLRLPTTGLGYRVVDLASMLSLPWLKKDGSAASVAEKTAEWKSINSHTELAPKGGFAFAKVATLHLDDAEINRQLFVTTDKFWATLKKALPDLETWPADAQLALMDQAWNMGPNFVGPGWPNFTAAAKRADFTGCALFCLSKNKSPRDYRHQRLYTNAATVVMLGADPETLWLDRTPSLPPDPTPTPTPEPLMHSSRWGTDYVSWRGGNFPPQTRDKLLAIPSNVSVTQGGLSFAKASAQTHAGLGAFDLNTDGKTKAQVWQQARELLAVGIIPFPRGFNWDSFQGKTIANTNDGNEHLHCIDVDEYDHLHPEAQAQVREWKNGGDGLVGSARYYGPAGSLGKWSDSPWNPVNIAKKELELPSTSEVVTALIKAMKTDKDLQDILADAFLGRDIVPNKWDDKDTNEFISPKTSLSRSDAATIKTAAKIDALAAAVAATFPKPTPDPTPPAA